MVEEEEEEDLEEEEEEDEEGDTEIGGDNEVNVWLGKVDVYVALEDFRVLFLPVALNTHYTRNTHNTPKHNTQTMCINKCSISRTRE